MQLGIIKKKISFLDNLGHHFRPYFLFRPPFINGRPQDSDSVFGRKGHYPHFLSQSVPFSFTSFRGHQESPGVTRGHQGETGGDRGRPGETGGDRGRPGETRGDRGRLGETGVIVGPPLAHRWA